MKQFTKREVIDIQAIQYGVDANAKNYAEFCKPSYDGIIYALPKDLLGTPKDAFWAVNTPAGFVKVQHGDWIVKKNNELFVIQDGIFQCLFEES